MLGDKYKQKNKASTTGNHVKYFLYYPDSVNNYRTFRRLFVAKYSTTLTVLYYTGKTRWVHTEN